jgi:hypothetical protein
MAARPALNLWDFIRVSLGRSYGRLKAGLRNSSYFVFEIHYWFIAASPTVF